MASLSDQQKTQLADLYDEAQKTGDTASMGRIRSALKADADSNNPAYSGTNQYFDFGSMSIKERPNNGLDTLVSGFGQRLVQAKNALRQVSDVYGAGKVSPEVQADVDEANSIDKPLNATPEGRIGNALGSAALATAVPGGGYASAAAGGALAGATMPTQGDDSRVANTAEGAVGGVAGRAAGSLVGAAAGRVISPIRNSLNAVRQSAVDLLRAHGVDLDLFQQTGDRALLSLKNAAADSPTLSPSGFADQQASQFTKAALKQMGVNADDASPAVMQAGKKTLQKTYDDIATRNTIQNDQQLNLDLARIDYTSKKALVPDQYRVVKTQLDDIQQKIVDGNGAIDGTAYQNLQSDLGNIAADGGKAPFVTQIRQTLTAALGRSASPGDAALLAQTNQRYAAMKAIQKAVTDQNQVSPAGLYNAMDTVKGANQTVFGQGANQDLVNLAQAGKIVLGKGTPNSGTPQRLAGQALFGAAAGIADSKAHGGSGAEVSMATLAGAIGGPALARSVIENPKVANAIAGWARNQGIRTAQDLTRFLAQRAGQTAGQVSGPQATQSAADPTGGAAQ